jgi:hypothetical protein
VRECATESVRVRVVYDRVFDTSMIDINNGLTTGDGEEGNALFAVICCAV